MGEFRALGHGLRFQAMSRGVEGHVPITIVGAGFAGIGLAIKLREAGIHDFTILERADELGGTWRDNTYPGCACDVASNLYSYSFAPNPDWSRAFSRQEEILGYLRAVAQEHDCLLYTSPSPRDRS